MAALPSHPGDVKRLLDTIGVKSSPITVTVSPQSHSITNECFPNVEKQVELEGGEIVYGWQLWQSDNHFIEAEFHAVWKDPDGNLLDITPKPIFSLTEILFVPDESRTYQGKQVNNIRLNLSGNKVVDQFIELNNIKFSIENKGDRAELRSINLAGDELKAHRGVIQLLVDLEVFMKSGSTVRNPCFCGSNEKYKKCHGRMIDMFIQDYKE